MRFSSLAGTALIVAAFLGGAAAQTRTAELSAARVGGQASDVEVSGDAAWMVDGDSQTARVVYPVDGDTIVVRIGGDEVTVRLLGVDTPETVRPNTPVECGGKDAAAFTAHLLPAGATVIIEADPARPDPDKYGRLLAYVHVRGTLVNDASVRNGFGVEYTYNHEPYARQAQFRDAQTAAETANAGIWGVCGGGPHQPLR